MTNTNQNDIREIKRVFPELLGEHPLRSGKYKIRTIMIDAAIKKIIEAIDCRVQGIIIFGASGYGKSTAINIIKDAILQNYNSEMLVFTATMPDPLQNTKEFYSRLLKATSHDLYNKGTKQDMSDRLCSQLVSLALNENSTKKILFFIDEADALDKVDYQCLKDINNQLDLEEIKMTTVLVGTEDLIAQRNLFNGKKETQIIRRFMEKSYRFDGIKSVEDLRYVLGAYDFGLEYPVDSGWTFTKYFFVDAFESGHYLSHLAADLYKCICNIYSENIFKNHGLSMDHLTKIVEYVLLKFGSQGLRENWITYEMLEEAVKFRNCGHVQDLINACERGKRR
jgi:hypothetical protein